MAQLVKLLDYISRYEQDLTRYPTQYIRLKTYQWERMKRQWENGADLSEWQREAVEVEVPEEGKWFSPLFRLFGKRTSNLEDDQLEIAEETQVEAEDDFSFNLNIIYNPTSVEQLRKLYLDQLFHFQIKWASSTLMEKSRVDARFLRDSLLRSFTQQLPDSYLLFYYPILKLKKAPVELDIVIVTPIEVMCITVLENEDIAAYMGGGTENFWVKKSGDKEAKVLNPLLSLNRMAKIISGIFKSQEINFPVRKYLVSRNGYIDCPGTAFDLNIIDRRAYEQWFTSIRKSVVPMKFSQFKAAQAILDVGQTTSISQYFDFDEEQLEKEQSEGHIE